MRKDDISDALAVLPYFQLCMLCVQQESDEGPSQHTFQTRPKPIPSEKPVIISLTRETFLEAPSFVNICVARMTCVLPDIVRCVTTRHFTRSLASDIPGNAASWPCTLGFGRSGTD